MRLFSISTFQLAIYVFAFFVFAIAGGTISYIEGMDIGPDLTNYHLYSGELVIEGRGADDVVPAALQTFHNPIYYGFYYLLFSSFPAVLVGFLLGAFHGLIGYATFFLTLATIKSSKFSDTLLAFIAGGLALYSPFVIATIGSSFSDTTQSLMVIFAISVFFYSGWDVPGWTKRRVIMLLLCGLLCGLAVGLKISHFFMATSLGVAIILFTPIIGLKATTRNALLVGSGGVFGVFFTNIWWSVELFQESGSILYPYSVGDLAMVAAYETPGAKNFPAQAAVKSFTELIQGPFDWSIGIPPRTEWNFSDSRILISLPVIITFVLYKLAFSIFGLFPRSRPSVTVERKSLVNLNLGFLIIFFVLAYLQWALTVGSIRYAIGIFALSTLIAFTCIYSLTRFKYSTLIALAAVSVYISNTMTPTWFGRMNWETSWAEKLRSQPQIGSPAVYLSDANSFWVPYFNDQSTFLRVADLRSGDIMFDKAKRVWAESTLPKRVLLGLPYGGSISGRSIIDDWLVESQTKIDIATCQKINIDYADYQAIHCDVVDIKQQLPGVDFAFNTEDRLQFPMLEKSSIINKKLIGDVGFYKIFDSIFLGKILEAHVEPNYYSDVPVLVEIGHGPSRSFKWVGNPGSFLNISNIQDAPENLLEFKLTRHCVTNGFPNAQNDHYQLNLYALALKSKITMVPGTPNFSTIGKRFMDYGSAVELPKYLVREPLRRFEFAELEALVPPRLNSPVISVEHAGLQYVVTPKDRNGLLRIDNVSKGNYLVRAWVAGVQPGSPIVYLKANDRNLAFRASRCFTPINIPVHQSENGQLEIGISDEKNSIDIAISKLELIQVNPLSQDVNFSMEHSAESQFFTYVNFPATPLEQRLVTVLKSELTLPVQGNNQQLLRLKGVNPKDEKDMLFEVQMGKRKWEIPLQSYNFEIYIPLKDVPLSDRMRVLFNIVPKGNNEVDEGRHVVISEVGLITDAAKDCPGFVNLDAQTWKLSCKK